MLLGILKKFADTSKAIMGFLQNLPRFSHLPLVSTTWSSQHSLWLLLDTQSVSYDQALDVLA
jgi:hypothetical protein